MVATTSSERTSYSPRVDTVDDQTGHPSTTGNPAYGETLVKDEEILEDDLGVEPTVTECLDKEGWL